MFWWCSNCNSCEGVSVVGLVAALDDDDDDLQFLSQVNDEYFDSIAKKKVMNCFVAIGMTDGLGILVEPEFTVSVAGRMKLRSYCKPGYVPADYFVQDAAGAVVITSLSPNPIPFKYCPVCLSSPEPI